MANSSKWVGMLVTMALWLSAEEGVMAVGRRPIAVSTQNTAEERWSFPDRLPTPAAVSLATGSFSAQQNPDLVPPPTFAQSPSSEPRLAEADRLFQQGIEQFNRNQFREALASWQQALELYRALGDSPTARGCPRKFGNYLRQPW